MSIIKIKDRMQILEVFKDVNIFPSYNGVKKPMSHWQ